MKETEMYNQVVFNIATDFAKRYYKEMYDENVFDFELHEYAGINGGPLNICDMYFSIDDVLVAEHNNIPCKIFEEYYDLCMDTDNKPGINLINYFKKNKDPEEYEKQLSKDLKRSEENVKKAKKELFNAIKK